jgi:hypothetical protein
MIKEMVYQWRQNELLVRIFRSFQLYSILLFIAFFVGCRNSQTNSPSNIAPSPTSQSAEELKTVKGRVVRKDGWKVPMPPKRRLTDTVVETVASENGKAVKVKRTTYLPLEDFIYTDEPFTPEEAHQLSGGLRKLRYIDEFRVKEKVYAYLILVISAEPRVQANDNTAHDEHPFTYRIVDSDGDGKFETLLPDDDVELKVPAWAADGI